MRSSVGQLPVSTGSHWKSPRKTRSWGPWCCGCTRTGRKPCPVCWSCRLVASTWTHAHNTNNYPALPSLWLRSSIFPINANHNVDHRHHILLYVYTVRQVWPLHIIIIFRHKLLHYLLTKISSRLSNKSSPRVWSLVKLILKLVIFNRFCTSGEYGSSYMWCRLGGNTLKITYVKI